MNAAALSAGQIPTYEYPIARSNFMEKLRRAPDDEVKERKEAMTYKCCFPPCPENGRGKKALQVCGKVINIRNSFSFG
jgi:hypothetical protein